MARPPLPITRTFLTSTITCGFMTPLSRYALGFGAGCAAAALDRMAVRVKDRFWRRPTALEFRLCERGKALEAPSAKARAAMVGERGIRRPCWRRAGARPASDMVDNMTG